LVLLLSDYLHCAFFSLFFSVSFSRLLANRNNQSIRDRYHRGIFRYNELRASLVAVDGRRLRQARSSQLFYADDDRKHLERVSVGRRGDELRLAPRRPFDGHWGGAENCDPAFLAATSPDI